MPLEAAGSAASAYLPRPGAAQAALEAAPEVAAALASRDGAIARADGIRAGPAEFVVRATGQQRRARDPSDRYTEGQVAIERQWRTWGKAEADAALADATVTVGQLAVDDTRHMASRLMLALWFDVLRARETTAATQNGVRLANELVTTTDKRVRARDAATMDLELAQAELARVQAALATARSAQRAAEASLQSRFPSLGVPGDVPETMLPPSGDGLVTADARTRYLQGHRELRLAIADEALAQRVAQRTDLERRPDPVIGAFVTMERGGSERIAGLSVAMPLGSPLRRANAAAAAADANATARRREAVERRAQADFEVLARTVVGSQEAAQAQASALALDRSAADRAARAYAAGELGVGQLLIVRRNLADTTLAARNAVVSALEAQEQLRLELHLQSNFE